MFKSIRNNFLIVFIAAVMGALGVVMVVSYLSIDSVYMNINERITKAEFDHISNEVSTMISETETLVSTRITTNEAMQQLIRFDSLSVADLSYAVNGLSREVIQITSTYSHIDSIYIFVLNEWFLAMSHLNTRQLYDASTSWPSDRVLGILQNADNTMQVGGYVFGEEFPLRMEEPAYLLLFRTVYSIYGPSVCVVNIKESALNDIYASYMDDGLRCIRIVDRNGIVVSSSDKAEIGTKLEFVDSLCWTKEMTINTGNEVTNCVPIEKYGLSIISTLPSEVYTAELTTIRNQMLLAFALCMVILSVFFSLWIDKKLKPLGILKKSMQCAGQGDYEQKLDVSGNDEFTELIVNYNSMLSDLKRMDESKKQAEIELRDRELAALRNEINPHFLYNTLNTIKCMANLDGNDEIAKCIVALGGIVAPLYKVRTPSWPLLEEVTLAQKYIDIMNIRYGNTVEFEVQIPENLLKQQVMRFILQPILENSIQHGFSSRANSGRIVLSASAECNLLLLTVDDDGTGLTDQELAKLNEDLHSNKENGGVGILNISRRIYLRHGAPHGVLLRKSMYGGLCTQCVLPLIDC